MKTADLFAVISLALSVSAAATFQLEDGRRQIPLNVGQGNNNLNDNDTIALEQLERNGGGSNVILFLKCWCSQFNCPFYLFIQNGASTNSASSATSVSSASPVASESTNLKLSKYRVR